MKILQLTTHFSPNIGGVETHLSDLVEGLVKRNHAVFVLTYRPLVTKADWKLKEKDKNLEVLRLPWLPGFFNKFVKSPVLEFLYLVPGLFLVTPFVLVSFRPRVIHSHGLIAGFVAVFWGKVFGTRVITTTHSIYHFPKRGYYRTFAKFIFENSDSVLTLSKQSAKEIERLKIDKRKIKVFTYWVDLKRFKKVKKVEGANLFHPKGGLGSHPRGESRFIVLFVGRLVREKGILVLLKAAKKWNKNITLAVIGTGPLEEEIYHQSLTINHLIYLGKIDNEKLPLYYSSADLVIVPSIHEEGFGRVILESLACGTPVIASNRGAIPEAMDETVGKLIDVTPENIKKAVEFFYRNPDKLERLSKNTRKFAEERYSEKNVEKIIWVYKF